MTEHPPDGWRLEHLRDIARVVSGGTPSRYIHEFWLNGTIPWVTPTDLTATPGRFLSETCERITERGLQSCSATLLPIGTLLMTSRATLGEIRIATEEVCTNQGFKSLVPTNGTNGEFLFYQMLHNKERYQSLGIGSTFLEVNKKDTERFEILVASTGEQPRIAEILSTVDEAIEQTEALIAKAQQIKAGLMRDLFTHGLTSDGQLRPSRHDAPHLYKESPLGWIPKEWETGRLADRRTNGRPHLKTGPFGSSLKLEHWVEEGRPVITIGALGEGEFLSRELLHVSQKTAERLRDYQLEVGDVVFSRVADVGRSAVIHDAQKGWIMSSNLMRISLDRTRTSPDYLQAQLAYDSILRRQIRSSVNAGGRDVANGKIMNRLIFLWPPLSEQERIVARLNCLETSRFANLEHLDKLRMQKAGLMQDLLTGGVRVSVGEK